MRQQSAKIKDKHSRIKYDDSGGLNLKRHSNIPNISFWYFDLTLSYKYIFRKRKYCLYSVTRTPMAKKRRSRRLFKQNKTKQNNNALSEAQFKQWKIEYLNKLANVCNGKFTKCSVFFLNHKIIDETFRVWGLDIGLGMLVFLYSVWPSIMLW